MLKQLLPILLFVGASAAHAAPIYTFSTDDLGASLLATNPAGGVNTNAGTITSLTTSYNSGNQNFTWDYTVGPGSNDAVNDGFWLVVSDGPNPKGDENEYAILYGDLDNNIITAYVYNGENRSNSYRDPGVLLGSFTDAIDTSYNVDDGTTNVSVMIDATDINAHRNDSLWDGIVFGAELGIWFHPTAGTTFSYDLTASAITSYNPTISGITSFAPQTVGYYDTNGSLSTVTTVPEPTSIALLSIGAVACFGFRRRKAKVGATI